AEFEGGGNVEDVEAAMAAGESSGLGNALAGDDDVDEVQINGTHETFVKVFVQISDHFFRFVQGVAELAVLRVAKGLEAHSLAKLPEQKAGNVEGFGHLRPVCESLRGVVLRPVKSAEEGGVRISGQLRSPSSASLISRT